MHGALYALHILLIMPVRELLQIIEKEQWPPNNYSFEYHGDTMSGEQCMKLF